MLQMVRRRRCVWTHLFKPLTARGPGAYCDSSCTVSEIIVRSSHVSGKGQRKSFGIVATLGIGRVNHNDVPDQVLIDRVDNINQHPPRPHSPSDRVGRAAICGISAAVPERNPAAQKSPHPEHRPARSFAL